MTALNKCESPITVLKILYTLAGGGPRLQSIEPIGKSGTACSNILLVTWLFNRLTLTVLDEYYSGNA